ncbi:MAG: Mrp/NBP35 family ATP-binding protein [Planctomycetales bacterium]|nr:Mrp/NBP35 family ATP-binding protein [Planctomycetales bacterium]
MTLEPATEQKIREEVGRLRDPETGRNLSKTNQVGTVRVVNDRLVVTLHITTYSWPLRSHIMTQTEEAVRLASPDLVSMPIDVQIEPLDRPPVPLGQFGLSVKSIIAVGSGKGGVGKSTIATSIALRLQAAGAKVGLMDADVYGPSVPHLLGLSGRPEVINAKIQPIYFQDIPVMSMGFLVEANQAVIWRGPMLHGSIAQFLRDTYWGALDYLIVDMPPGTGDVALTLSQLVPLAGAVVVCTPQQVALLDAVKAVAMFQKTKIPVLGMVENMSGFVCTACGQRYDIFGRGGAREKAEELSIPFLGEVPLNIQLREDSDSGNLATALENPICSTAIDKIVQSILLQLSQQAASKPAGAALPVL